MTQRTLQFSALLLAFSFSQLWVASQAQAQRSNEAVEAENAKDHDQWYYNSEEKPKKTIAMQKAELKAQQRMDRLASQKWYGFTPGRPTAATMPFTTSMYSPAWTRPGGQPFAWYTGYQQPIIENGPWGGYRYW
jgi:hypothetical protein